jgi:hypothetical protein
MHPSEVVAHLLGVHSLLRQDDDGRVSLVHQSVLEWLVARIAGDAIVHRHQSAILATRRLPELAIAFLCDHLGRDNALHWAREAAASSSDIADVVKDNAMATLTHLRAVPSISLGGMDCRGRDFSGQSLAGADLHDADLGEARLVKTDLTGACLDGARLVKADLSSACLRGASMKRADLTLARLLSTDLTETRSDGAIWRRAKVIPPDTRFSPHAFRPLILPTVAASADCHCLAWSPEGDLLANGHADGSVRLWDSSTGAILRSFPGHDTAVWRIAFSPNGFCFATMSRNEIKLWQTETGALALLVET